ncbi:hypothetical protein VTN96DRAFT_631 [Rasamsonia emersonii]
MRCGANYHLDDMTQTSQIDEIHRDGRDEGVGLEAVETNILICCITTTLRQHRARKQDRRVSHIPTQLDQDPGLVPRNQIRHDLPLVRADVDQDVLLGGEVVHRRQDCGRRAPQLRVEGWVVVDVLQQDDLAAVVGLDGILAVVLEFLQRGVFGVHFWSNHCGHDGYL